MQDDIGGWWEPEDDNAKLFLTSPAILSCPYIITLFFA